jgi:signal transduction histidine kinase
MRKDAEGTLVMFVTPGLFEKDGSYSYPVPYLAAIPALQDAADRIFDGGESYISAVPYTDEYGQWITVLEPLLSSEGTVEAILGVDYLADDWYRYIDKAGRYPLFNAAALFVIGIVVLILGIEHQRRKQQEWEAVTLEDERMRSMLEAVPFVCNLRDSNLNLIDCTPESIKLFGFKNKQECLRRFKEHWPETQPNGRPTQEVIAAHFKTALEEGSCRFASALLDNDGAVFPVDVTFIRFIFRNQPVVVSYIKDLRQEQQLAEMREVDERLRLMLEAMPISCCLWDIQSDPYHLIDCNRQTLKLFELENKEQVKRLFHSLSPEYQPNGKSSRDSIIDVVHTVYQTGYLQTEWMHQKLDGTPLPVELTVVSVKLGGVDATAAFLRDLREHKKMLAELRKADERARLMLDALPVGCCLLDTATIDFQSADCNRALLQMFDLERKEQFGELFYSLSPEYQPNGKNSRNYAVEVAQEAHRSGYIQLEWMHQKLDGTPLPVELTVVRVQYSGTNILAIFIRDLREHNKMRDDLRKADERARLMLDSTPLCCEIFDENFNVIDCNLAAVHLYDLKDKQEYLDRFFELMPPTQPDGRPSYDTAREYIATAFRDGYAQFEWMHQKPDGTPIPAHITLVRVFNQNGKALAAYAQDLREQKRMLAELRDADERAQLMLDAVPLCCQIWDKDFNAIDCNLEALRLFGMNSKQEYFDRFFELMPPTQPGGRPSRELVYENFSAALRDGYCRFDWMCQKLDGTPIPAEITLARVLNHDGYAVTAYVRDLRELKKKEEERQLYALELEKTALLAEQARKEAEEASRIKSEFLANISHELRTPLNAVIGLSEVMLATSLEQKQRMYIGEILSAGKSLLLLINDILEFSNTVSDDLKIHAEPFNLRELIDSVIEILASRAAEKHLEFSASIDPKLPPAVYGVMGRIRQVLIIMVNNAIKFTKQGSIRIEVSMQSAPDHDMKVMFRIIDTGIGISVDHHDRLFKVFSQVDGSATRAYGGTGISLALALRLVQLMGGEVGVESEEGKGSTFWFELPLGCPME